MRWSPSTSPSSPSSFCYCLFKVQCCSMEWWSRKQRPAIQSDTVLQCLMRKTVNLCNCKAKVSKVCGWRCNKGRRRKVFFLEQQSTEVRLLFIDVIFIINIFIITKFTIITNIITIIIITIISADAVMKSSPWTRCLPFTVWSPGKRKRQDGSLSKPPSTPLYPP